MSDKLRLVGRREQAKKKRPGLHPNNNSSVPKDRGAAITDFSPHLIVAASDLLCYN